MRFDREPKDWRDRNGTVYREVEANVPLHSVSIKRVPGPIEEAFASGSSNIDELLADGISRPNPLVTPRGSYALYTWLVEAPSAKKVLLWASGLVNPDDIDAAEFSPLGETGVWALTAKLPASWRASYRIAVSEGEPPWRSSQGYGPVHMTALTASRPDPRAADGLTSTVGTFSLAAGPDAPAELWRIPTEHRKDARSLSNRSPDDLKRPSRGRVRHVSNGYQQAWIYSPETATPTLHTSSTPLANPTPLLLLFDGGTWMEGIKLPHLLDAAIASGAIAPIHVAMLDAGSEDERWESLGVPCGQVDAALDWLLPLARQEHNVSREGRDTWVAGQSLGGLSALWTVALSEGEVRHAIAQSPALWRFNMAEPLIAAAASWDSIDIKVGTFEGTDHLARELADRVPGVDVESFCGGHDWACWRAGLFHALASI